MHPHWLSLDRSDACSADPLPGRNKPFIVCDRRVTFGDAWEEVRQWGVSCSKSGLAAGDLVVVGVRDDLRTATAALAMLLNGFAPVFPGPCADAGFIEEAKRRVRPRAAILDHAARSAWSDQSITMLELPGRGGGSGRLLRRITGTKRDDAPAKDRTRGAMAAPELDAVVFCASERGAGLAVRRLTRRDLTDRLAGLSRRIGLTAESRILNALPLSGAAGLLLGPLIAFANGATLYRPEERDIAHPGRLVDSLYRHRITHMISEPAELARIHALCRDRNDHLRTGDLAAVVSAGTPLDPGFRRSLEERLQVMVMDIAGLPESAGEIWSGSGNADRAGPAPERPMSEKQSQELADRIIGIAALCFNVEPADLTIDAGVRDTAGWDSFAHLELVTALEAQFKIHLTPAEVMRIKRLSDAWHILKERLA